MNEILIKAENISKSFGSKNALSDVSFEIRSGEVFAFLGPNGAGKTTAIKILTGLIKPTGGKAFIGGYDVSAEPLKAKKILGYMPDQPFLYPKLKGFEYIDFIADIYELPAKRYADEIGRLSELLDLEECMNELIESYSQGMRQKLLLLGAFFRNPSVIIMDEPMVGLDPKSARVLKHLVGEYSARGTAFFISTHTLEIAEKLASKIGIIKSGKIIMMENKENLLYLKEHNKSLEDLFLELTGGLEVIELLKKL